MREILLSVLIGALLLVVGTLGWKVYTGGKELNSLRANIEIIRGDAKLRVADLERKNGELEELLRHAEEVGGDLVGGVVITVPADTIERPVGETPITVVDTATLIRTATLADTLDTGHEIYVTATTGDYPDPIHIGYKLILPEFNPQVGFIRRGDQYFAIVHWADQKFEVAEAFYTVPKERSLGIFAGMESTTIFPETSGRVYMALRYSSGNWNFYIQGGTWMYTTFAYDRIRENPLYVGVRVERRIW